MPTIIRYTFYSLTILLPLTFTTVNFELFELPKFLILLAGTTTITLAWLIHYFQNSQKETKKLKKLLTKNPLNYAVLAFLLSQIISTIFSIHPHTSLWGYYSRFHQGLLTTISYTILYFAYLRFGNQKTTKKLLKTTLITSFLVSTYAILQKLGIDKNLWVQDVVGRPFSTLGQPNWLAAYLLLHFFLSFYLYHQLPQEKTSKALKIPKIIKLKLTRKNILFTLYLTFTFLAFLFTKSRSGLIGFAIACILYLTFSYLKSKNRPKTLQKLAKPTLLFLLLLSLVGTPFTQSLPKLTAKLSNPKLQKPSPQPTPSQNLNPLEAGTKSTEIRKIVWQGALDLVKQKPFIGTGVETFAYSYYRVRPELHNYVSEWDFLYNKAHNELLNIAANSGLIGLTTYLSFFAVFTYLALKKFLSSPQENHLYLAALASLAGIFTSNFFGFSVIPVAFLAYLLPALAFTANKKQTPTQNLNSTDYLLLAVILSLALIMPIRLFLADYRYQKGKSLYEKGQITQSIPHLQKAIKLRPKEARFYTTYVENLARLTLLAYQNQETKNQASNLEKRTLALEEKLRKLNPYHLNYYKSRAKSIITLAQKNPDYYQEAASILQKAIKLAPTDAKLYYNLGLIYSRMNQNEKAIQALEQSLNLKNDYENPYYALSLIYEEQGSLEKLPTLLEKAKSNLATYSPQLRKKVEKYTNE